MSSIVNGLFAGRSGIASHGTAIAVVGDNISNSSTIGFKASRSEFEDLVSGGQASNRVVGSGSQIAAVSTIFTQGTLESTGRQLDLAIAGNGFFVLNDGGQRFYSRAGNFKVNSAGFLVNQNNLEVLGFPAGGSGALERININNASQDTNISTSRITVTGNVDASSTNLAAGALAALNATTPRAGTAGAGTGTYADLTNNAEFSTVVEVFDTLGAAHTITVFFFKTNTNEYTAQAYVNAEEVLNSPAGDAGEPRLIYNSAGTDANIVLQFNSDGTLQAGSETSLQLSIPWANGSSTASIDLDLSNFTQFSTQSNVTALTQNGKGVGSVGSISISQNGEIFALLSNGQSSIIGTIGLVNFSNPEGLTRSGNNLLQQSPNSGEPIVGRPGSGTLGTIESGRIELSTVDIADQFVKLITLQRGFQANSRIITTINQLLNDIIQLA